MTALYRVLAREGALLRIARVGSGEERVVRGEAAPGDFVELGAEGGVKVVTAFRGAGAFPDVGGEVFRLAGRRLDFLRRRDLLLRRVRQFFWTRGFVEIETPLLVPSPGLELHLDAIAASPERWLITSPEYQMKRLLAAGAGNVFQICKCFRKGELGPHHNPEFTMIEWYRSPGRYEEIMEDCEALLEEVAPEERPELARPVLRMSMKEAFARFAGCDVPAEEESFFSIYLERVEPMLGREQPVILYEWPAYLAALARRKPGDETVALRFELFASGIELANAFDELTDPKEQEMRLLADQAKRRRRGKEVYPIDARFLAALAEGLPPSAGIALGLDRLAMLLFGAQSIREVLAFAADEV